MRLSIIVAMDDNQLIGNHGKLPWHLPEDLRYFKKMTLGKTVIMGRKTYESIGKPLPNRRNIIISHNAQFEAKGCEVKSDIGSALECVKNNFEVFIMGGALIYQQMLPLAEWLYITHVEGKYQGDAYFPKFDAQNYREVSRESHQNDGNALIYHFIILQKKPC